MRPDTQKPCPVQWWEIKVDAGGAGGGQRGKEGEQVMFKVKGKEV